VKGEAALLNESFFEGGELAGEEVTGEIQEGKSGVGDEFGELGLTRTDMDGDTVAVLVVRIGMVGLSRIGSDEKKWDAVEPVAPEANVPTGIGAKNAKGETGKAMGPGLL
jgi:hypothetical protein